MRLLNVTLISVVAALWLVSTTEGTIMSDEQRRECRRRLRHAFG